MMTESCKCVIVEPHACLSVDWFFFQWTNTIKIKYICLNKQFSDLASARHFRHCSEPISLCSFSSMLPTYWRSSKYQLIVHYNTEMQYIHINLQLIFFNFNHAWWSLLVDFNICSWRNVSLWNHMHVYLWTGFFFSELTL
jgi:hypothetical protein